MWPARISAPRGQKERLPFWEAILTAFIPQLVVNLCSKLWPGKLLIPAISAGQALGIAKQTIHNHSRHGQFPIKQIPLRSIGSRHYVSVSDIANYLAENNINSLVVSAHISKINPARINSSTPRKRGRPRKVESIFQTDARSLLKRGHHAI